jgi:hypothetical protein
VSQGDDVGHHHVVAVPFEPVLVPERPERTTHLLVHEPVGATALGDAPGHAAPNPDVWWPRFRLAELEALADA